MKKLIKTEDFIEQASAKHENKYHYSNIVYPDLNDWIMPACPHHGPFHIIAIEHLNGKGCDVCVTESERNKERREIFIERAYKIHGERYNYSLTHWNGNNRELKINCYKHGDFMQLPEDHLNGHACPKCKNIQGQ